MKNSKTQTSRIRQAMAKNPLAKPKQIADQLGISPRAVHMVKYLDKKRATQAQGKPNNTPKRVSTKKVWSPTTQPPTWISPGLLNNPADQALKAKIEEIKASNPDQGKPMALWEIVVICIACIFMVEVGMRMSGVK